MIEKTVEIYSEAINAAIIKAPGRHYPGILIQGDSLANLVGMARTALDLFETDRAEALDELTDLYQELNWRLEHYCRVLTDEGTPFL